MKDPKDFVINPARLAWIEILAGIMDSDGSYDGEGFDITLKSEKLLDDEFYTTQLCKVANPV